MAHMQELNWNVLQVLPEAIIIVDNDDNTQFMNSAAIALFEVSEVRELIGNPLSILSGGTGLMTYEERVEYTNRTNKFALNKAPIPEPDDAQRWIARSENKLFYFLAIPIQDDSKKKTSFVIRVNDLTNEQAAIDYLAGLASDMASPIEASGISIHRC